MNMPFQMLNMPIITANYWGIGYGMNSGEAEQDLEGMQTMRTIGNNLAWPTYFSRPMLRHSWSCDNLLLQLKQIKIKVAN